MALPAALMRGLHEYPPREAWGAAVAHAWDICSPPFESSRIDSQVTSRDRHLSSLDLVLATGALDLWGSFESELEKTSEALVKWWASHPTGRAILILDGLSLRELPWLIAGAKGRGFRLDGARATASELPGETQSFARALGFGQRSSLANDGAGHAHKLIGARTESGDIPWSDCCGLVGADPDWVFWHCWPDVRLHGLGDAGQGLGTLARECADALQSDAFWQFVERLTTGRPLIITSDHGYAATGLFPDTSEEQSRYLKALFGSKRSAPAGEADGTWVPPLDLTISTRHGKYRLALGRRKWKSQGGYPTLAHGGLSILEVLSPFIELSRTS
jgi:hypothetical protein